MIGSLLYLNVSHIVFTLNWESFLGAVPHFVNGHVTLAPDSIFVPILNIKKT